jgi:hypothetical protein
MKTLKSVLVAGSLLVSIIPLCASAQGVANIPGEHWLSYYYENPRPDDLPVAVHQLSRGGYFERVDQPAMAIGFFATVFAQNPQRVDRWLAVTSDLPEAHRRILAAAAWQAGNPKGLALLREMSAGMAPDLRREIAEMVARGPVPVAATPVKSESSMNLQWGAFLASGDEQPIVAVLAAFGSQEGDLNSAARYSLAQNAAEHRRVLDICRAQLDKQPESVRSEVRAALNEATAGRQPGA